MMSQYITVLLLIIGFIALFPISRYQKRKQVKIDEARKALYELGIMVEGEVMLGQSYLMTMLDAFLNFMNSYQRKITYKFIAQDGKICFGQDYGNYNIKLFFANAGYKVKVIYDANNPINNLLYTARENKRYMNKKS